MRDKDIIIMARILSAIFSPFYLPVVGLIALLLFSTLSFLPWQAKLYVLIVVYSFTILLPTALIRIYRRYNGWSLTDITTKERRMIPYLISIVSYFLCYYIISANHIPYSIGSIVVASLFIQLACGIINQWYKISTHMAAIGGVMGGLMAFSLIYSFNPVWWLCLVLVMAGLVGSSRMILRQHTLGQVITGFLVGWLCAIIGVLYI